MFFHNSGITGNRVYIRVQHETFVVAVCAARVLTLSESEFPVAAFRSPSDDAGAYSGRCIEDDHDPGRSVDSLRLGLCTRGLASCPSFSISCPKTDHWRSRDPRVLLFIEIEGYPGTGEFCSVAVLVRRLG